MVEGGRGEGRAGWSRTDLWIWPCSAAVLALAVGLVLDRIRTTPELSILAWPGDVGAASATLQVVATSAITTTSLTFSLTVVALQLASQQSRPACCGRSRGDPATKAVLAILVATFVLAVTVLRDLRTSGNVPAFAMLLVSVLGVVALGSVLGRPVTAAKSGFVQLVHVSRLVDAAAASGAVVRLEATPGDHVVGGTPIALVDGGDPGSDQRLDAALRQHVVIGYERTMEQDVAFGFRQLTDIAVKALSPGVNDPVTAAHCMGHLADLFVLLSERDLGPRLHADADGVGRLLVRDRDLQYFLELVCGQIRRSGQREPSVLSALLRMLRDVGANARDDGQRRQLERQVDLVLEDVPDTLAGDDAEAVKSMADRARMALAGDPAAFEDRSGETRSL